MELPPELKRGTPFLVCDLVLYFVYFNFLVLIMVFVEMVASKEDMDAYRIPIHCRDYCAHVLIPLNM